MKKISNPLLGLLALEFMLVAWATPAAALTAKEIVAKADRLLRGATSQSTVTMKIIRPDWSREITLDGWSRGDSLSFMLIREPARDKGTTFLKRGNEVWQWVPSINRVIKIPPSMMSQSWMGSDFTNDDLVKEASIVNDYEQTLLADTAVDGITAYQVKLVPKPDAPVVWGHVVLIIGRDDFIEIRGFYYDEAGKLVNTLLFSDVKVLGGRKIPTRWEMIPSGKPGQETRLVYKSMTFDGPISESFFSLQNMKQVR